MLAAFDVERPNLTW